ncbi:MAG: hypothetical protein EB023_13835, partial [Flavobacteriia bacterium]|nr:hypothetical protein [Flavobacteriia bacterium]
NLSMVSTQGTWTTSMNVYFLGTGTKTINSGAKNFGSVYFAGTGTWSNTSAWNTGDITVSQAATLNFTNNITMQQMSVSGAANITFSALATMNSTMNINAAATVNFLSTSSGTNTTLSLNGLGSVINFNANRTINNGLNLYNGTINTNGTTCTWGSFYSASLCNNSAVRALNLGSSTINVSGSWYAAGDPGLLTINPGTSTINMSAVGATFTNFQDCFTPNTTHNYYNVNFTAASGTAQFQHHYNNSTNKVLGNYNQVTFGAGANITGDWTVGTVNFALNGTYTFQAGRTVTVNTLFNANATCAGPMTIKSATAGTQAIISKANATVTMNYCNIQDMNFTGGATVTATNSINQGNNTGITIQAGGAAAARTLYWVGGSGNWNDINRWSLSSGGAGGECPPTSIDDVIFNNSSFSAVNQTVTLNVPNANFNNMTWSVTQNSPNFASSSSANNLNIYGNLSMVS